MHKNTIVDYLPKENRTSEIEYSAIDQIIEGFGLQHSLNHIEEAYVLHTQARGYLPSLREDLIRTLRLNTDWRYEKIIGLVNRVENMSKSYPSYDLELNERLDALNTTLSMVKPFELVETRVMGVCDEMSSFVVYDGTNPHQLIKLCEIDKTNHTIVWGKPVLSHRQQRWVLEKHKELKNRIV